MSTLRSAFTLIELLVVIAIIALLIGHYVVVVSDPRSFPKPGGRGKERPPPSRVPPRYTWFADSPLKADASSDTRVVNLALTGGSKR